MNALTHSQTMIRLPSQLWFLLLGWFTLAVLVGISGLTRSPATAPLTLAGGVTLPILIAYIAWRRLAGVRAWVAGLNLQALVALHAVRTVGVGFILLSLHGHLHPGFAWPAGIGDLLTAVGALLIGIDLARGADIKVPQIRRWNRFGMLDFVIAVAAGFSLRSALLGDATLNTDLMGSLPLALFPLFLVPLMFMTHLAIAVKLRQADDGSDG